MPRYWAKTGLQDPSERTDREILDGMPLALHIAAYHLEAVPYLSLSDYIRQLEEKIKELKLKDNEDKAVIASLELSLGQLRTTRHGAHNIAF